MFPYVSEFVFGFELFRSCTPDLEENAEQNQHYAAPDKNDFLDSIVADSEPVVLDVWIAIEKLVPLVKDEEANSGERDDCDCKCNAQRWNAGLFNHRRQRS